MWVQWMIVIIFGIGTIDVLLGQWPWIAVPTPLFVFGLIWALRLRRKYGYIGAMMRPQLQIPTYLAWAAISPAYWICQRRVKTDPLLPIES